MRENFKHFGVSIAKVNLDTLFSFLKGISNYATREELVIELIRKLNDCEVFNFLFLVNTDDIFRTTL